MRELVVAREGELKSNSEGLDGHDRDGANGGAYREVDECVFLAVYRSNLVDHEDGECYDGNGVKEEA